MAIILKQMVEPRKQLKEPFFEDEPIIFYYNIDDEDDDEEDDEWGSDLNNLENGQANRLTAKLIAAEVINKVKSNVYYFKS